MTFSSTYQIFETRVVVTDKDRDRLLPHLASWVKLNELFLLGINAPDLQRLVLIELKHGQRAHIVYKLLARYGQVRQQEMRARIEEILS